MLSVHEYYNKLRRKLRVPSPVLKTICTFYRTLFILALILQYYLFMKYFEIKHSPIDVRTPTAAVELSSENGALNSNNAWIKLKRNYFSRRQKWKVPKSEYNRSGLGQ